MAERNVEGMDVVTSLRLYIDQMLKDCGEGMKAFLLDRVTLALITQAYSQSELGQKGAYLFELLDVQRGSDYMKHVSAIVFVQPTKKNIESLCTELSKPYYSSYFVYFSHFLEGDGLENALTMMARADEQEVVKEVKEMYYEYLPVTNNLFTLSLPPAIPRNRRWDSGLLQRACKSLTSVLLSLRCKPVVRYIKGDLTEELSRAVVSSLRSHPRQFTYRRSGHPPLLLILDRCCDSVTPILNPWTYHAQVHELFTISRNKVDSTQLSGAFSSESSELMFSSTVDDFLHENMYLNFGEIGEKVQEVVQDYQGKVKDSRKLETIQQMKNFVDNYPQYKKLASTTFKHLGLTSEISRIINQRSIMTVSELEQEIVEGDEKSDARRALLDYLTNKEILPYDCVRLCILYQLRYGGGKETGEVMQKLKSVVREGPDIVQAVLDYDARRTTELFARHKMLEKIKKKAKKVLSGQVGDVQNIYVRHTPSLKEVLKNLLEGRLSEELYPTMRSSEVSIPDDYKPDSIIVFFVGGTTYSEAKVVADVSAAFRPCRIILGGMDVHNSRSFLEDVLQQEAPNLAHLPSTLWDVSQGGKPSGKKDQQAPKRAGKYLF